MLNLLSNARDAFEDVANATVTIRTGSRENKSGLLEVWLQVKDNGKGIPKAEITKIFDPFYTTKEVGKGTGLGLSISYNIIKQHQGMITVNSVENQGTTFEIVLPAIEQII